MNTDDNIHPKKLISYKLQAYKGFAPTPQRGVMSRVFFRTRLLSKLFTFLKTFLHMLWRHKKTTPCLVLGFTLIELLVTVSMFIIITSVVLVNFPSFSSKISLENLAHEVALAVRQAQVFGVSSREFGTGSGIFPTHGVHFDKNQNTTFFLFVDTDDNGVYTGASELSETFTIQRRNYISEICGFLTPTSDCTLLDMVDITFTRPNPEPSILGKVDVSQSLYSYATITVTAPTGATQTIAVWSNGQIAIQ